MMRATIRWFARNAGVLSLSGGVLAGALALSTYVAAAQTTPAADAASAGYVQAQALFREKKYDEAIAALDAFIATHPRDVRAIVLRGDSKANAGRNADALKDYNSAIGIDPEYQYAYVTRCETRLQLDDDSGALQDCNTAVRLDPSDALAYEDRADVYFSREAYAQALSDYDAAVKLGRSSAYVFAARCDAERLVGKRDLARTDCDRALTIDPKSRRGLWARGRLALTEARYTDGIADLNAYIALDPKRSTTAYYFRGLAYNRLSSYRQALDDLKTYVERTPSDPDGYRERALALFGTGDRTASLADLDAALRGYRKDGNTAQADHVATMIKDVGAGKAPAP